MEIEHVRQLLSGTPIRAFDDLVDFLGDVLPPDAANHDPAWIAGATAGTVSAFLHGLRPSGPGERMMRNRRSAERSGVLCGDSSGC